MKKETIEKKIEGLLKKSRHLDLNEICIMSSVLELRIVLYDGKIKARSNMRSDLIACLVLLPAISTVNQGFWIFTLDQVRGIFIFAIVFFLVKLAWDAIRYGTNKTPTDPTGFVKGLLDKKEKK